MHSFFVGLYLFQDQLDWSDVYACCVLIFKLLRFQKDIQTNYYCAEHNNEGAMWDPNDHFYFHDRAS